MNESHGIEIEPFGFFVVPELAIVSAGDPVPRLPALHLQGPAERPVVMLVLIALYTFVTRRTTIGRRIYAMGGNEKATKLSGINTERLTLLHLRQHGRACRLSPA